MLYRLLEIMNTMEEMNDGFRDSGRGEDEQETLPATN